MQARRSIVLAIAALSVACAPGPGSPAAAPAPVVAADSAIRAAIARERAIDPASFPPQTVGVAPFVVNAADTSLHVLGYGLADFLSTDLAQSNRLRVVDRLRVDAFLRETGLARAGLVDSASAPRMGRLLGARQIVTGALTATTPTRIQLDGRLGDVVTGRAQPVRGTSTSLERLFDAEKAIAFAIFQQMGITLTSAERLAIDQRRTRDLAALLAYSRGIRAETLGDFSQARAQYGLALARDPGLRAAGQRLAQLATDVLPFVRPSIERAGAIAAAGINRGRTGLVDATDPAFRARLAATIIVILDLP